MNPLLLDLLACPRCRGRLRLDRDRLRCVCGGDFAVASGVPRLNDDAGARDAKIAAELEAQQHAHPLYVDRSSILNRWEEQVLPRLVEAVRGEPGPVLDLGCGVGHFGRAWAEAGLAATAPMIGMDLVVDLLGEVTSGYAGLLEGDVHRMPLRDGGFGAVVVANALHHMADPVAALREIGRVLRPGGLVVAYDPRALAPLELIKKLLRRHDNAFGEHHRAFGIAEYQRFFADAGFAVERLVAVDAVGPLVATALDMARAGRLGVAAPVARWLSRADDLIAGLDRSGRLGLMLLAQARSR